MVGVERGEEGLRSETPSEVLQEVEGWDILWVGQVTQTHAPSECARWRREGQVGVAAAGRAALTQIGPIPQRFVRTGHRRPISLGHPATVLERGQLHKPLPPDPLGSQHEPPQIPLPLVEETQRRMFHAPKNLPGVGDVPSKGVEFNLSAPVSTEVLRTGLWSPPS